METSNATFRLWAMWAFDGAGGGFWIFFWDFSRDLRGIRPDDSMGRTLCTYYGWGCPFFGSRAAGVVLQIAGDVVDDVDRPSLVAVCCSDDFEEGSDFLPFACVWEVVEEFEASPGAVGGTGASPSHGAYPLDGYVWGVPDIVVRPFLTHTSRHRRRRHVPI